MIGTLSRCAFISLLFGFAPRLHAEKNVAVNLGFTLSKSVVGLSYVCESNEINVGLKSHPLGFLGDLKFIQPGLTFNRAIHKSGIYGSVSYAPVFVTLPSNHWVTYHSRVGRANFIGSPALWKDGWNLGELFFGLGKTFQFENWGLHVDGNMITPVTSDITKAWGYWIGAGASYRFNLD